MKTTFGTSKHRSNYYLLPAINLIVNKKDYFFKANYQLHFSFLTFHAWVTFEPGTLKKVQPVDFVLALPAIVGLILSLLW